MTDEEINKYVDMGDIEKDEEVTTERAIAELYRWARVVNSESYEYENLTPKVLDMAIKALEEQRHIELAQDVWDNMPVDEVWDMW